MAPDDPVTDTPVVDTPAAPEVEESMAEHEAAFAPTRSRVPRGTTPSTTPAAPEPTEPTAEGESAPPEGERDAQGRFVKTRHRAKSQEASPDDVPTIAALTKQLRELDAEFEVPRHDGESQRVYELRRRVEMAQAVKAAKAAPTQPAAPVSPPPVPTPPSPAAATKPKPEDFATYEEYLDARDVWNRAAWTAEQRARDEQTRITSSWQTRVKEAMKTYPDFEEVALRAPTRIKEGTFIDAYIWRSGHGAEILYTLQKDPAELDRIDALRDADGRPDVIAQAEALSLLAQRRATSRVQAAPTGSAATPPASPAPRPPNPVRTGPMRTGDEPPGDDASLAEHEKAFGPRRLRR